MKTNQMSFFSKALLLTFLLLISSVFAQTHIQSTKEQNIMIELFSSEGCSSCPPAEKWLNGFESNPNLWTKYIPLSFHVTYWDRLGWKDSFAQKDFTTRQYMYKQDGHTSGVYTPGFMMNSKEWRAWFNNSQDNIETSYGGILSADIEGKQVQIKYAEEGDFRVHIALLGFGLKTKVPRGENKGRLLKHNFVVLNMNTYFLDNSRLKASLPRYFPKAKRYAVVVWICPNDSMQVLQSIGGWLNTPSY